MAQNPFVRAKQKRKESKLFRVISTLVIVLVALIIIGITSVFIKRAIVNNIANSNTPDYVQSEYYFNSLSWKDQQLYSTIVDASLELKKDSDILPYSYDMDTFQNVIKCIMADNPNLFYVDFSSLVINHGNSRTYVSMSYFAEGEELNKIIANYNTAIDDIVSGISGKTEFEKELAVHDYICSNCDYAIGQTDRLYNTSYGAFVYKCAYCDGYAYAAKALFDKLGIESTIVYGSVGGSDHVWNIVKIDGEYYHLDVMWDDANLTNNEDFKFHGYFNLCDEMMLIDHSYEKSDFLPTCTKQNSFYDVKDSSCKTLAETEEIIYNLLIDAAKDNKRDYIELYCEESVSNEKLAPYFKKAVEKYNAEYGKTNESSSQDNADEIPPVFLDAFQVYDASNVTNSVTIQIFYN